MYGLTKLANEYPQGYNREDVLREQLEAREKELRRLEDSIPDDIKRDRRNAALTHGLTGTAIGGLAGAGLFSSLERGKGRTAAGIAGGLTGSMLGALGGGISGNHKAQKILDQRAPDLAANLDKATLDFYEAEDRLTNHFSYPGEGNSKIRY